MTCPGRTSRFTTPTQNGSAVSSSIHLTSISTFLIFCRLVFFKCSSSRLYVLPHYIHESAWKLHLHHLSSDTVQTVSASAVLLICPLSPHHQFWWWVDFSFVFIWGAEWKRVAVDQRHQMFRLVCAPSPLCLHLSSECVSDARCFPNASTVARWPVTSAFISSDQRTHVSVVSVSSHLAAAKSTAHLFNVNQQRW